MSVGLFGWVCTCVYSSCREFSISTSLSLNSQVSEETRNWGWGVLYNGEPQLRIFCLDHSLALLALCVFFLYLYLMPKCQSGSCGCQCCGLSPSVGRCLCLCVVVGVCQARYQRFGFRHWSLRNGITGSRGWVCVCVCGVLCLWVCQTVSLCLALYDCLCFFVSVINWCVSHLRPTGHNNVHAHIDTEHTDSFRKWHTRDSQIDANNSGIRF